MQSWIRRHHHDYRENRGHCRHVGESRVGASNSSQVPGELLYVANAERSEVLSFYP